MIYEAAKTLSVTVSIDAIRMLLEGETVGYLSM